MRAAACEVVPFEAKLGLHASTLHHASKACRGEGRSALRRDHEGRDGMLLQSSLVSIAALSPSSRNASISKLIGVRFGKPLCKMLIYRRQSWRPE